MARILFFDDEASELWSLIAALEAHGHAVTEAHNPDAAAALITEQQFDLLILDIMMPMAATKDDPNHGRRAGWTFYEKWMDHIEQQGIKTLVLTKVTDDPILSRIAGRGLPVLTKPVLPSQLVAKVKELVGGLDAADPTLVSDPRDRGK